MSEKHFTYEAANGKKYKVNASHFLGNFGDTYGYMFNISSNENEFNFMVRLPRSIALKKWKLPSRTEEENALLLIGNALIKRELDKGNERNNTQLTLSESMAKPTLKKTLQSLE